MDQSTYERKKAGLAALETTLIFTRAINRVANAESLTEAERKDLLDKLRHVRLLENRRLTKQE